MTACADGDATRTEEAAVVYRSALRATGVGLDDDAPSSRRDAD